MTEAFDFDRAWMEKFRAYLDETVGEEIREVVIRGGENLSAESSRLEVLFNCDICHIGPHAA
jgi:L-lysine 2,3-aminomutase